MPNLWDNPIPVSDNIRGLLNTNFPYCQDVLKYEKLDQICQGKFGDIFKARNKVTNEPVALKKLKSHDGEGFPFGVLREMKLLRNLKHENVINLIEMCRTITGTIYFSFYLVFECCEYDLSVLLSNENVKFNLAEIKMVMKQLFDGLHFIHSENVLHRDIKTANIHFNKSGTLKILDFTYGRIFRGWYKHDPIPYPKEYDATFWYKPPELLLEEKNDSIGVDMWGAGCVMAEMLTRTPIMQGTDVQHQIILTSDFCGSINEESLPGLEELELYNEIDFPQNQKRKVKEILEVYEKDPYALDLVDKLLAIDPSRRIDTVDAFSHDFFVRDPMPADLEPTLSLYTRSNA